MRHLILSTIFLYFWTSSLALGLTDSEAALRECGDLLHKDVHTIPDARGLFSNEKCTLICFSGNTTLAVNPINEGFECDAATKSVCRKGSCVYYSETSPQPTATPVATPITEQTTAHIDPKQYQISHITYYFKNVTFNHQFGPSDLLQLKGPNCESVNFHYSSMVNLFSKQCEWTDKEMNLSAEVNYFNFKLFVNNSEVASSKFWLSGIFQDRIKMETPDQLANGRLEYDDDYQFNHGNIGTVWVHFVVQFYKLPTTSSIISTTPSTSSKIDPKEYKIDRIVLTIENVTLHETLKSTDSIKIETYNCKTSVVTYTSPQITWNRKCQWNYSDLNSAGDYNKIEIFINGFHHAYHTVITVPFFHRHLELQPQSVSKGVVEFAEVFPLMDVTNVADLSMHFEIYFHKKD